MAKRRQREQNFALTGNIGGVGCGDFWSTALLITRSLAPGCSFIRPYTGLCKNNFRLLLWLLASHWWAFEWRSCQLPNSLQIPYHVVHRIARNAPNSQYIRNIFGYWKLWPVYCQPVVLLGRNAASGLFAYCNENDVRLSVCKIIRYISKTVSAIDDSH